MNNNSLVGMPEIKSIIEKTILTHTNDYELGIKKKPTYIVMLNKGQGRSKLLESISDVYNKQITFPSGLDPYIEIENIKPTISCVEEMELRLSDAAVYKPHFEEVCGVDISEFSKHLNECQTERVIKVLKEASEHCIMLFFFSQKPNKSEERLVNMLREKLDITDVIIVSPYTADEYARIVINYYKEFYRSFKGSDFPDFERELSVKMKNVASLSEAFKIGESFFDKNLSKLTTSLYVDEIKNEEVKR